MSQKIYTLFDQAYLAKQNKNFDKMIFFSLPTTNVGFDILLENIQGANLAEIFKFEKEKLLQQLLKNSKNAISIF